jgi:hypothetical protein
MAGFFYGWKKQQLTRTYPPLPSVLALANGGGFRVGRSALDLSC